MSVSDSSSDNALCSGSAWEAGTVVKVWLLKKNWALAAVFK